MRAQALVVVKKVAIEELPPLLFPGQKAEIVTCEKTMSCHHCRTAIPKGAEAVAIRSEKARLPSGRAAPTFTFCGIPCQRKAYVEKRAGKGTWQTG